MMVRQFARFHPGQVVSADEQTRGKVEGPLKQRRWMMVVVASPAIWCASYPEEQVDQLLNQMICRSGQVRRAMKSKLINSTIK